MLALNCSKISTCRSSKSIPKPISTNSLFRNEIHFEIHSLAILQPISIRYRYFWEISISKPILASKPTCFAHPCNAAAIVTQSLVGVNSTKKMTMTNRETALNWHTCVELHLLNNEILLFAMSAIIVDTYT